MTEYPKSPVPSDDSLSEGELPFTAFGQWGEGRMDNRVFQQDVYWVDVKGAPHLLAGMDEAYRLNVIMFLRENMDYFFVCSLMANTIDTLFDMYDGRGANADYLLHELGMPTLVDLSPEAWLEGTPLMRSLRRLTGTVPPSAS